MTWQTRTWVDGEFIRAGLFNNYVSNNFNHLFRYHRVKTSDQSTTSTSGVAVTGLTPDVPFVGGEVWIWRFSIIYATTVDALQIVVATQASGDVSGGVGGIGEYPAAGQINATSDDNDVGLSVFGVETTGFKNMTIWGISTPDVGNTQTLSLLFASGDTINVTIKAGSSSIFERVQEAA